jgi:hypothetical protein
MKLFSKSKGYLFAEICGLIYIIVTFSHSIFYSSDFFNLSDQEALRAWILRITAFISLSLAIGAIILFGIRELRKTGFSKKKLLLPLIGIFLCLFSACAGWGVNRLVGDLSFVLFEVSDCNITDLDQSLAMGEIDMETYSKGTFLIAQNRFLEDGSIIEYTMPNGEVVPYEPNEDTLQVYEEMHQVKRFLGSLQKSSYWNIYHWTAVAMISIILGFVTPIKKGSNQDQVLEVDA